MESGYAQVVADFARHVARHHAAEVHALYLGGSVARGEHIPGRSDIDFYLVTQAADEVLEATLTCWARAMVEVWIPELVRRCQEPVSVSFTRLSDVAAGTSWLGAGCEYAPFMRSARLLWGTDIRPQLPAPSPEAVRLTAEMALEQLADVARTRMTDEISDEALDAHIRDVVSAVFKAGRYALAYGGTEAVAMTEVVEGCAVRFGRYPALVDGLQQMVSARLTLCERRLGNQELWEVYDVGRETIVYLANVYKRARVQG